MTGERPEEGAGGVPEDIIPLDVAYPIWERVFTVSPLVVVGTREGGTYDLAPKHMVTALGWDNHFGFVCTRRHGTYRNAVNEGEFTVSFPRPDQVVLAGLSAAPRDDWHGHKRTLGALPTFEARVVNGVFLAESHLFLECPPGLPAPIALRDHRGEPSLSPPRGLPQVGRQGEGRG